MKDGKPETFGQGGFREAPRSAVEGQAAITHFGEREVSRRSI